MNFDIAFDRVFDHEGVFQRDHMDRGNWTSGVVGKGTLQGTKFGISAMSYPDLDIYALTREQAKEIYRRDWWNKLGMARFRPAISFQLFDAALNHGMHNATKMVQRAARVNDDGIIGPITFTAMQNTELNDLLLRFLAERLEFMTKVSSWPHYGKGWARRIATNLRHGAEDN